jgi:hypothetical protein
VVHGGLLGSVDRRRVRVLRWTDDGLREEPRLVLLGRAS